MAHDGDVHDPESATHDTPGDGTSSSVIPATSGAQTERRGKSPSVHDLIRAYQRGDPAYEDLREKFASRLGSTVEDEYFAKHISSGAILLREAPAAAGSTAPLTYRFVSYYDSSLAVPDFDHVMLALQMEQLGAVLLHEPAKTIVVQRLYAVVVQLLNSLDAAHRVPGGDGSTSAKGLRTAASLGSAELVSIRRFVRESTRRTALARYLLGLPLGAVVAGLVVGTIQFMPFLGETNDNTLFARCLAFGAIGAIVSVMTRITRGQQLDVDINQGLFITMLAGAFRPIIGAAFGAVLFVLIVGGLLPFALPKAATAPVTSRGEGADIGFFFAGLAFLAGFSERWAQDTIVQSVPKVPSTMRDAPRPPRMTGGDDSTDPWTRETSD